MSILVLLVFVVLGIACLVASATVPQRAAKGLLVVVAPLLVAAGVVASSVRFVGADEVGVVTKNAFGPRLTDGRIIATGGEMGVQAEVLSPGWHFGFWPLVYDVETTRLVEVKSGEVGLVESRRRHAARSGSALRAEVENATFKRMVEDAGLLPRRGRGPQGAAVERADAGAIPDQHRALQRAQRAVDQGPRGGGRGAQGQLRRDAHLEVTPAPRADSVMLAGDNERGVRRASRSRPEPIRSTPRPTPSRSSPTKCGSSTSPRVARRRAPTSRRRSPCARATASPSPSTCGSST